MPPKKKINKKGRGSKPKAGKKDRTSKPERSTKVSIGKISNKPQNQNVNVSVNIGKENDKRSSNKSSEESKQNLKGSNSIRQLNKQQSFAPTIIPQYVSGNPPPQPPQQPQRQLSMSETNRVVNTQTPPIMTSLGSLQGSSFLGTTSGLSGLSSGMSRISGITNPSGMSRQTSLDQYGQLRSPMSETYSYIVNDPSFISDSISELSSESYDYSTSMQTPSGMNLQSVESVTERQLQPAQMIYNDGSIQLSSEEQPPLLMLMDIADEPQIELPDEEFSKLSVSEKVQQIEESKRRGRKAGKKNRPREEIEAEKIEKEKRREIRESKKLKEESKKIKEELEKSRRAEFITNRYDEIDRRITGEPTMSRMPIGKQNRFDELERDLEERDMLMKNINNL
jgi:hypothetical protein